MVLKGGGKKAPSSSICHMWLREVQSLLRGLTGFHKTTHVKVKLSERGIMMSLVHDLEFQISTLDSSAASEALRIFPSVSAYAVQTYTEFFIG